MCYYPTSAAGRVNVYCCFLTNSRLQYSLVSIPDHCMYLESNVAGNNVGSITKKNSWRECSEACKENDLCHAISFNHNKDSEYYRNCHLKNDKFAETYTGAAGVVSVPRVCNVDSTGN